MRAHTNVWKCRLCGGMFAGGENWLDPHERPLKVHPCSTGIFSHVKTQLTDEAMQSPRGVADCVGRFDR